MTPDRADEIARGIAMQHGPAMTGGGKVLADTIAAALRSYGREYADERVEAVALAIELHRPDASFDDSLDGSVPLRSLQGNLAALARSLKSHPESKEPTR